MTTKPFKSSKDKVRYNVGEKIHSDLVGPLDVPDRHTNARYIMTLIDHESNYCNVKLLKSKSECTEAFKDYITMMERFTGNKVKVISKIS